MVIAVGTGMVPLTETDGAAAAPDAVTGVEAGVPLGVIVADAATVLFAVMLEIASNGVGVPLADVVAGSTSHVTVTRAFGVIAAAGVLSSMRNGTVCVVDPPVQVYTASTGAAAIAATTGIEPKIPAPRTAIADVLRATRRRAFDVSTSSSNSAQYQQSCQTSSRGSRLG
ncbi:hypothetical protein [Nonomuraea insulae]|uniref:Uncharacterized protein n=1 Tax=Nonomuraea insulae TaxID=1616787 RepID=A0ABW1CAN4_9ACTN